MKCYLIPTYNFYYSDERRTAFLEEYKKVLQLIPIGEKLSIIIVTNSVSTEIDEVPVSKAYIRVPDSLAVIISEKLHSFTEKVVPEITDDDMVKILYPKATFRDYAVCDKWESPDIDTPLLHICQIANTVAIMNFEPVVSRKGRSYRAALEISASGDTPEEAENTLKKACNFVEWKGGLFSKNGEKSKTPLLKRLCYSKTLSEETCAEFFSFLPEECIEDNGFCYGVNVRTGKPVVYNRSDFTRIPHRCVVGGAGSGKSFLVRDEIRQIFENTSDDVVIFSQCGEYGLDSSLYERYGMPENDINAVFLSTNEDDYHINPMDIVIAEYNFASNDSETERILQELTGDKGELVIAIFEALIKRELTFSEKVVIHNATDAVFRPFIEKLMQTKTAYSFEDNPTISDVTDYIRDNVGALGKQMNFADCSELLTAIYKNADCFRCFSYKTNIPTDRMLHICYLYLPDRFYCIADIACVTYACNRMLMNRGKKSRLWMYWENIEHLFFYDENKAIADRFKSMVIKSRTHGVAQTILVYEFSDIAKSFPFHNIGTYTFLHQASSEMKLIQDVFGFSDEEIRHLILSGAGEGLFYTGRSTIPFKLYPKLKKKEQEE